MAVRPSSDGAAGVERACLGGAEQGGPRAEGREARAHARPRHALAAAAHPGDSRA
jgi:hypothetical protein